MEGINNINNIDCTKDLKEDKKFLDFLFYVIGPIAIKKYKTMYDKYYKLSNIKEE